MVFDPLGYLVVADAGGGCSSISPRGEVSVLATGVSDRPFGFLNDLDIGPDGTLYVSDASTRFGYGAHQLAILEHGGDGQLLAWNPVTRCRVHAPADGLQFPNGVVVEPSGESLLFAETGAYRIRRYWLKGDRAGTTEVVRREPPGFPDNISRTPDGRVWVPMSSPRHPLADALAPWPFLRKVVVAPAGAMHARRPAPRAGRRARSRRKPAPGSSRPERRRRLRRAAPWSATACSTSAASTTRRSSPCRWTEGRRRPNLPSTCRRRFGSARGRAAAPLRGHARLRGGA